MVCKWNVLEHVQREKPISILKADTNMKYWPEKTQEKWKSYSPQSSDWEYVTQQLFTLLTHITSVISVSSRADNLGCFVCLSFGLKESTSPWLNPYTAVQTAFTVDIYLLLFQTFPYQAREYVSQNFQ